MSTNLNMSSAKIYRFTPRKRDMDPRQTCEAQVIELRPVVLPHIVYCAGASYHEAAIAEEARLRGA